MSNYKIKKNSQRGSGGVLVLDKKGRIVKQCKNRKKANELVKKLEEKE